MIELLRYRFIVNLGETNGHSNDLVEDAECFVKIKEKNPFKKTFWTTRPQTEIVL